MNWMEWQWKEKMKEKMKEKEAYEKWNLRWWTRHLDDEMTPR